MTEKMKVGRRGGALGNLAHAFTIQQAPGGGLLVTDVQSLTDVEHTMILGHFGRPLRAILGVGGEQHYRTLQPGTELHYYEAAGTLPWPFALMSGAA